MRPRGRIVSLYFWSLRCPWSQRVDGELWHWPQDLISSAETVRLACNADETAEEIRAEAESRFQGTVLLDPHQTVADLYEAQVTPHFFLIDKEGLLRYRGAFDDAVFRRRTPTQRWLEDALHAVLRGEAPDPAETLACGCAITRG
jgi:hypothetical protein